MDKLLWIDLETTGLNPHAARILEVCAYIANFKRPFSAHYLIDATVHDDGAGLNDEVRAMHTRNGLLGDCAFAGQPLDVVERVLLERLSTDTEPEDSIMVAGNSVHFDLGFLRVHMPTLAKRLHYRCYDVSAVRQFCESIGMPELPELTEEQKPHRAFDDVIASIELARHCAAWIKTQQGVTHE